jgi:hypothetical protein
LIEYDAEYKEKKNNQRIENHTVTKKKAYQILTKHDESVIENTKNDEIIRLFRQMMIVAKKTIIILE